MLTTLVAILATLTALGCAGLLSRFGLPERRAYALAWGATTIALALALAAMSVGFVRGFSPALLRAIEVCGALIAPFALVLGVVELAARTVQARFAARLVAVSYLIVAVVIILLDPITGAFDKTLPRVAIHYASLPRMVLDGAHGFTVVSLIGWALVTVVRANRRDRPADRHMLAVGLVAPAGVLMVAVTRGLLPGPLAPLALAGAAGLIAFGGYRVLPDRSYDDDDELGTYHDMSYERDEPRRSGRAYPSDRYGDGRYGAGDHGPGPYGTGEHASGAYPAQEHQAGGHPSGQYASGPTAPGPAYSAPSLPGQYSRITMYTLREGHGPAFDALAAEVVRSVRAAEPGTLIYSCHAVDDAADQRIFYQMFRDAAAVEEHTRQPHVQQFARAARAHVTGTNVIELTVTAAKVAPPVDTRPNGPAAPPVPWQHG